MRVFAAILLVSAIVLFLLTGAGAMIFPGQYFLGCALGGGAVLCFVLGTKGMD